MEVMITDADDHSIQYSHVAVKSSLNSEGGEDIIGNVELSTKALLMASMEVELADEEVEEETNRKEMQFLPVKSNPKD